MSLVLNMIGGGGSFTATDAILRVQAPANSVVTISKGATTKTDLGHENLNRPTTYNYYFIIHQSQFDSMNAWTVTATRGTDTNSTTVIINVSDEYDVSIGYHVPIGVYQEVEYLESDGNQSIATGATNTTGWDVEYKYNQLYSGSTTYSIMGGRRSNNARITTISHWNGNIYIVPPDGSIYPIDLVKHRAQWGEKFNWSIILDGNVMKTASAQTTYFEKELALFCERAADTSGNITGYAGKCKCRIYKALFYNGETCVREFYPCYRLSDSVAGMYDKINGVFYTNTGSGTFTVGADV